MNEECLYFLFSDFTAKAFVLLVGFEVSAQPLALEFSIWIETIVYVTDTCGETDYKKLPSACLSTTTNF